MAKHRVKCRYGVEYTVTANGSNGAQLRLVALLSSCCCWVCHNRDCQNPMNEILPNCGEVCELYTKTPYCKNEHD